MKKFITLIFISLPFFASAIEIARVEGLSIDTHTERFEGWEIQVKDSRQDRKISVVANDKNALSFCKSKGFETVKSYGYSEAAESPRAANPLRPYTGEGFHPAVANIVPSGEMKGAVVLIAKGVRVLTSVECASDIR